MTAAQFYRWFFRLAAVYDVTLGLSFFLAYPQIYAWGSITLPNHPGYVQLPALWLAIMGIADAYVARDLIRNRAIVVLRILMKVAYSALCLYHFVFGSLPVVFLAIAIGNVVFLVPQCLFFRCIPPTQGSASPATA